MPKQSRYGFALLISTLILCSGLSCSSWKRDSVSGEAIQDRPTSAQLVWPELLEQAGLETVWERELPLRDQERLGRLAAVDDRLYVLSTMNHMFSLRRDDGLVVFNRPFGKPGFTVLGIESYHGKLFSIVGNRLMEIEPEFGRDLRGEDLGFGVTCPAARTDDLFYVAGSDRRLRVLRADDWVKLFELAAENDSPITSVVADDGLLIFATDAGNVIAVAPDRRKIWQFDASDGIVEPIVRDGQSLYAASKDTYVYKLDVRTGTSPIWKYQTRAILDRGPVVTEQAVYQYVHNKGLTAIDKESGKFIWHVAKGAALLAESGSRAYVITNDGELVVMDNRKRARLYSANFAGVSWYATNIVDEKLYIADQWGRIACLRPTK
jgi:outer membrane protein assembly factor BamB